MAARLAWPLALVSLIFAIADTVVTAAYQPLFSEAAIAVHGWPFAPLATVGAAAMGAVILTRYPRHLIGWLLSLVGVFSSASLLAEAYSIWVLDENGPGAASVGHVAGWLSVMFGGQVALGLFAVVFLTAPDGRLLSRRWRYAAAAALVGIALYTAGLLTLSPVEFTVPNSRIESTGVTDLLFSIGILLIMAGLAAAVVTMVIRVRRARGVERRQLRLIVLAASAIAGGLVWMIVVQQLNGGEQDWLAAIPLFAGYVPILFSDRRRGFQDWLARTVVVFDTEQKVVWGTPLQREVALERQRLQSPGPR